MEAEPNSGPTAAETWGRATLGRASGPTAAWWHFLWRNWLPGVCLLAGGAALGHVADTAENHIFGYLAAAFFGLMVGATEIAARYRDDPTAALQSGPGFIYVVVNGAASLAAFWLLDTGQLELGLAKSNTSTLNKVLLAGFGSMALFRTSIFRLRVRDADVAVGPAAVLQVILNATDRACDRLRAGPRAKRVKDVMHGVSYARAKLALQLHCLALMQNVSAEEHNDLQQAIASLDTATMSDEVKAYNLGLLLMNIVGEDVLQEAIDALGSSIQGPPADEPPVMAQAGQLNFADMASLLEICIALDPMQQPGAVAASRQWLSFANEPPNEKDKNLIVLARLRRYFGPETVSRAIALMTEARKTFTRVTVPLRPEDLDPKARQTGSDEPNTGASV